MAVTAGCVESSGYPNSSYSANRGYNNNGYYRNNTSPSSNSPFYSPSATRAAQQPNRYDRDANGDGIPDNFQR